MKKNINFIIRYTENKKFRYDVYYNSGQVRSYRECPFSSFDKFIHYCKARLFIDYPISETGKADLWIS